MCVCALTGSEGENYASVQSIQVVTIASGKLDDALGIMETSWLALEATHWTQPQATSNNQTARAREKGIFNQQTSFMIQ